jgi:hypothetical protein
MSLYRKSRIKNEPDSLMRLNSSNPRTVLGVRIGAAPLSPARDLPVHYAKRRIEEGDAFLKR